MTQLRYDTFTYKHIQTLIAEMFKPERQAIDDSLSRLIQNNVEFGGQPNGFLLCGTFYPNPENILVSLKTPHRSTLHPSLLPDGLAFIKKQEDTNKDELRLTHGLSLVLAPCKTLQDIRDALPDGAKIFLPDLAPFSRTRPEAWSLEDKPLQMHQYLQTQDLFYYYLSSKMAY